MTTPNHLLPRTRRPYFSLVNGLLWGSVSTRWVLEFMEHDHPLTLLLSFMLLLFGLLLALKELLPGWNERSVNLYVGFQTVLVFTAALLFYELDFFALLFLPLSIQSGLALPRETARRWTVVFVAATIVGQITQFGFLQSLPFSMLYVAGILFTALLIENTLTSEASSRRSEALLEELREANRQLEEHSRQAEELAAAEERNRLARELHDSIAQTLYGLTLRSEAAHRKLLGGQVEAVALYLREFQDSIQQSLQETRLLIHKLRPEILEKEGLKAALIRRLENVERRSGLDLRLDIGDLDDMSQEVESALYYVAQEAFNNILKHARASQVQVRLEETSARLLLEIQDNGVGLPELTASQQGGLGFQGMRERVAQIGGIISISGSPGQGTKVSVEVPR